MNIKSKKFIIGGFAFSLTVIVLVAFVLIRPRYLLDNYGRETKGIVDEIYYGARGRKQLHCKFNVDNKTYYTSVDPSKYEYERDTIITAGTTVTIRYYPPDPTTCHVLLFNGVILPNREPENKYLDKTNRPWGPN
jgi:hypothetical protein